MRRDGRRAGSERTRSSDRSKGVDRTRRNDRSRRPQLGGVGDGVGRMSVGFVLLVSLSGATMALQGGGGYAIVGLSALGGCLVGTALWWYLRRVAREFRHSKL
ncbi:hypothetical protein [Natrarchaeobius chitinivorans]|uniref:Uncharacterized protein n=1 Tax=Natrarchaeobius chitinivorans TaxID=1679083 RepID=A0A3N6MNU6_NATCH|nr:hypothetical protein [Natrarchaeobius chitinivorans]RQG97801.1 hypothetical protein EA473_00910 [Natrarchaeobius chitinivorans]